MFFTLWLLLLFLLHCWGKESLICFPVTSLYKISRFLLALFLHRHHHNIFIVPFSLRSLQMRNTFWRYFRWHRINLLASFCCCSCSLLVPCVWFHETIENNKFEASALKTNRWHFKQIRASEQKEKLRMKFTMNEREKENYQRWRAKTQQKPFWISRK